MKLIVKTLLKGGKDKMARDKDPYELMMRKAGVYASIENYLRSYNSLPLEEQETIKKFLATLTQREEKVLRMSYKIEEEAEYSLEEVGQRFAVTRERIRQIKDKAIKKVMSPSRSMTLEEYLKVSDEPKKPRRDWKAWKSEQYRLEKEGK